uniref:SKA complex subunit 1 n=1 Tax=Angiostrongylus cantonensis TaxID=6313 RepID=A0A0K0CTW8_ANGCA
MSDHIFVYFGEEHLGRVESRKNDIVKEVESILSAKKIESDYGRGVDRDIVAKVPSKKAAVHPLTNSIAVRIGQPLPSTKEVTNSPDSAIMAPISLVEFDSIPKYMRGRMSCADLNEVLNKFNWFLSMKRELLSTPFNKLRKEEKNLVCKWKEQEASCNIGELFCQENDIKPGLRGRAQAIFRHVAPCLRHLHRIREEMSNDRYAIKRILERRKVSGKGGKDKMEYLVDWEPTWVDEQDMSARSLDDYYINVEVLGPIHSPENLQKESITKMDLVVQRRNRQDVPNDEVILELMPYEQVKRLYPDELFTYIESTCRLPEELCKAFEKNADSAKDSSGKKNPKKRKLTKK